MHDSLRSRLLAESAGAAGPGGGAPYVAAVDLVLAMGEALRTVVLVEGPSDQVAIETLARRRGRDLADEGVHVLPMGGARTITRFLQLFGPAGLDVRLSGLCDAREVRDFARGLARSGFGADLSVEAMEDLGFFVCTADLEDELINCLGTDAVERVLADEGDLVSFRIVQQMPAQRERTLPEQLRRFMGTRSGRKFRYGRALVDALDLADVPRPLDRLLAFV